MRISRTSGASSALRIIRTIGILGTKGVVGTIGIIGTLGIIGVLGIIGTIGLRYCNDFRDTLQNLPENPSCLDLEAT